MEMPLLTHFPSLLSVLFKEDNIKLCWFFQLEPVIAKWASYFTLEKDIDLIKDLNESFLIISIPLSRVPKRKIFALCTYIVAKISSLMRKVKSF